MTYNWQDKREKRYLNMQPYIIGMAIGLLLAIASQYIENNQAPGREISLAARVCWDQGMRAILHTDGSIECRP